MEDSLKALWAEADKRHLPQEEIKEDQILKSIHMKSKHVINKMKTKFLVGAIGNFGGLIFIMYFMFSMDHVLAYTMNIIVTVLLGMCTYLSAKAYFQLRTSLNDNLKESLRNCYQKVTTNLKYQNAILTFVSGNVVLAFMFRKIIIGRLEIGDPMAWLPYIAALLLIVPASYYLGKWSNRNNFGGYLNVLKKNIDRLETA